MNESFSVLELFKKSSDYLLNKGIKSHKIDTEWIFQEVLEIKKIDIFLDQLIISEKEKIRILRESIIRRGKREPLQHIIGHLEFYNCTIKSDRRALIPRFETESLVESIAGILPLDFDKRIYDFGTGTGAIIISLARRFPNSLCVGFDKSEEAISLAKENVTLNKCDQNTEIKKFDWNNDSITEKCDVLVSNPPYLSLTEWKLTEPEVKEYDPKCALVSDEEGMSDLITIITLAPQILVKGGLLALEFGKGQADSVVNKFAHLFIDYEIKRDLSGIRRFLIGKIKN